MIPDVIPLLSSFQHTTAIAFVLHLLPSPFSRCTENCRPIARSKPRKRHLKEANEIREFFPMRSGRSRPSTEIDQEAPHLPHFTPSFAEPNVKTCRRN